MKKRCFVFAALAAAALVSCSKEMEVKEETPEIPAFEGITVNVVAGNEATKTAAVDGATPYIKWTAGDKIALLELAGDEEMAVNEQATSGEAVLTESDTKASFATTLKTSDPQARSYQYVAVYPASALSQGGSDPNKFYRLKMPAEQTLVGNNFSTDSDILFSAVVDHGDSRVENDENLSFQFRRLGTVVRLQLKGITEGEKIQKVVFTAPIYVAGYIKFDPVAGNVYTDEGKASIYSNGTKEITLNVSDLDATGDDVVWFRVMSEEETWATGSKVSIKVETDKANYTRTDVELPKDYLFHAGGLSKLGFNLAAYREAKAESIEFTKVTDAGDIMDGAQYLIASTVGDNTFAMGAYDTSKSVYNKVDVTLNEGVIEVSPSQVITVTLEDAGAGKFYIKDSEDNYLYFTGSSNIVSRGENAETDAYKWTVTVDGITNVGTPERELQYNNNSGSTRFACYKGTQNAISLYVNEDTIVKLEDPGLSYSVDSPINVAWDSKDSFVEPTLTNPHGLSITYESDAEEVATVDENTGKVTFVGNGTVTITAYSAKTAVYNAGSASYQIKVTGAPAEKGSLENPYTVAEALAIIEPLASGNENKTEEVYVTGVISKVISYSSKYYSLTYNITADGTDSADYIQVYSGKGLDGANFSSTADLNVGDQVIIKGCLMKYEKSGEITPEIYQNSIIVSLTPAPKAPYFTAELSANTIGYAGGNAITLTIGSNVEWTASIDNGASLKIGDAAAAASVNGNEDTVVTVVIPENEAGETYTISFSTTSDKVVAPSNLTITQSVKPSGYSVTYTQSYSKDGHTVAVSGDAPAGSECTWTTTYSNANQLTAGNSMTYTINGFDGKTIKGLSLHLKTNASKGAGAVSMKHGSTEFGSYTVPVLGSTYAMIDADVTATTIGTGETVTVVISATTNSVYCDYITISYE